MSGPRTNRGSKKYFLRPYLTDAHGGREVTVGEIFHFLGGTALCMKLFNAYGVHCNRQTIYNWIEDDLIPPDAADVLMELFKDQEKAPNVTFMFGGSSIVLSNAMTGEEIITFQVPPQTCLKLNRKVTEEKSSLSMVQKERHEIRLPGGIPVIRPPRNSKDEDEE